MVKITSLLTAALFGAVAMAMPVAKPDVVVVTVYETAVAVPSPVNNVVIKTVYETVYARPANEAEPSASLIPHKPQPAPVVSAAPAPAPVLSVPPV
ncbi:hypothetical protein GGI09_009112, partial [Coemansia sp. S100]